MDLLRDFVEEKGGSRALVSRYTSRVTRKGGQGKKFDTNYFNQSGRRFRSMLEVGRFLGLVDDAGTSGVRRVVRKSSKSSLSREEEAEKKKLRKELERLRKALNRSTKSLDDCNVENAQPFDEQAVGNGTASPETCAANLLPDKLDLQGLRPQMLPDALMVYNFLATFSRALSLSPIESFQGFLGALVFESSDCSCMPPVYMAEAHLALLKLLLNDRSSDDWWWSTLETDNELSNEFVVDEEDSTAPPFRVDVKTMLMEVEDPLITSSWLKALMHIERNKKSLKQRLSEAHELTSNKVVKAYLKVTLAAIKTSGAGFATRAINWIRSLYHSARPDLTMKSVKATVVDEQRLKVINETAALISKLPRSVKQVLVHGQDEDELDEESDDSDEEEEDQSARKHTLSQSSTVPPRPVPTLVDLMLPPSKPVGNDAFVNDFTWPQMVGAVALRVIHRRKRLFNEVDDGIRTLNQLPGLSASERRERESLAISRSLSTAVASDGDSSSVEQAIESLCTGSRYLDLNSDQRLLVLRILVEASYDTQRVHEVVKSNYLQKHNAIKALETEQRRAKKEAKEKAARDEAIARERLAQTLKDDFIEAKRREIMQLNNRTKEFSTDLLESLTADDILEFDDEIKADYEALSGPESFSKIEVAARVKQLLEEEAFNTRELIVLPMDEFSQREIERLDQLKADLSELCGNPDNVADKSMDRDTLRAVDRLKRDLASLELFVSDPEPRVAAVELLKEAVIDGTTKTLKAAISSARKARLIIEDEEVQSVCTVEEVRDAAIELEAAKQNRRVLDAQKDLVAKMNRCFVRLEPLGTDRFGNRFWDFGNDDDEAVWTESEFLLPSDSSRPTRGEFVTIRRAGAEIVAGVEDSCKDYGESHGFDVSAFVQQEYHTSAFSNQLCNRHWGHHNSISSLRGMIKLLDSKSLCESKLKNLLKIRVEALTDTDETTNNGGTHTGDEEVFCSVKAKLPFPVNAKTAIGSKIRLEQHDDADEKLANRVVTGWDMEQQRWSVDLDDAGTIHVGVSELEMGMVSHRQWCASNEQVDEHDWAAYRNTMRTRHTAGKASEAARASTPASLARYVLKRENELYPKLKANSLENEWGKSGERTSWINYMKDIDELGDLKQGLLTLEDSIFNLTGRQRRDNVEVDSAEARLLLTDLSKRIDIELESIERNTVGLWNSSTTRMVYRELVVSAESTGLLGLAVDVLCRNTLAYLQRNGRSSSKSSVYEGERVTYIGPRRTTRSTHQPNYFEEDEW